MLQILRVSLRGCRKTSSKQGTEINAMRKTLWLPSVSPLHHVCNSMIDMNQSFQNQWQTEVHKLQGKIQSPYHKNKNFKIRSCPCQLVQLQPHPPPQVHCSEATPTLQSKFCVFHLCELEPVISLARISFPLICLENPFAYFSLHFNIFLIW